METVKNLALVMTIVINAAALIGVILRISTIVFNLKQDISELNNKIRQCSVETDAKINRAMSEFSRDIEATNHSLQIVDMKVKALENESASAKTNNEKSRDLLKQEVQADLKDVKSDIRDMTLSIRDLENFTQKQYPEFHVRTRS